MDILNRYRDNHDSSSSEDDSENSDNECAVWKRATKKETGHSNNLECNAENNESKQIETKEQTEQPQQLPEQPKPGQKRKRNTIWCDVLQDQLISEDLEDCLLKNKPRHYGSRGKESYDYTNAYANERRDSESSMSGCSLNDESGANSDCKKQKLNKKPSYPGRKKFLAKKFVKLDSSELDAARKINRVLNEKKYYLIQRIVKYAGIEKAMLYLEQTQKIEENGGLMIKSNSRRRTPGGVYLQMLKEDKDTTQEILNKVFEGELSGFDLKKYFEERRKKKKKKNLKHNPKAFKGVAEGDIEPMEPDGTTAMDAISDVRMLFAPMDAEAAMDEKPDVQTSDINNPPVPVSDEKFPKSLSELEEGEIED